MFGLSRQISSRTLSVLRVAALAATLMLPQFSASAQQASLSAINSTTLRAATPVNPSQPFLSTFAWAGGCDDNRVQA